jgi:hypothetical protein
LVISSFVCISCNDDGLIVVCIIIYIIVYIICSSIILKQSEIGDFIICGIACIVYYIGDIVCDIGDFIIYSIACIICRIVCVICIFAFDTKIWFFTLFDEDVIFYRIFVYLWIRYFSIRELTTLLKSVFNLNNFFFNFELNISFVVASVWLINNSLCLNWVLEPLMKWISKPWNESL